MHAIAKFKFRLIKMNMKRQFVCALCTSCGQDHAYKLVNDDIRIFIPKSNAQLWD